MATQKDTMVFIENALGNNARITSRAMFGEYALYADGRVVALVCDDTLYVKMVIASEILSESCDTDSPYPGAKPHYVISEEHINPRLLPTLFAIAASLPAKKIKK
jgi:TfoX/Sxy family transcriptional regulator of competence genes